MVYGTAVNTNTEDPRFESHSWQKKYFVLKLINQLDRKNENKREIGQKVQIFKKIAKVFHFCT